MDTSQKREMMNIKCLWRKKSRGVSPVIATVLLIGLVVVAGIGIAVVMFGTINAPDPIGIKFISIGDFETTDNNINIDLFSVDLENSERTTVRIRSDGFELELMNGTTLLGWSVNDSQAEIVLGGDERREIDLKCAHDGQEITPSISGIIIKVTVYPEDSTSEKSARTFESGLLPVGGTDGPLLLTISLTSFVLEDTGSPINFTIINYGSKEQDLDLILSSSCLESCDNTSEIVFNIDGVNRSTHSFSLGSFSNTTLSNIVLYPPDNPAEAYYVTISLKRNLKTLEEVYLILEYEG